MDVKVRVVMVVVVWVDVWVVVMVVVVSVGHRMGYIGSMASLLSLVMLDICFVLQEGHVATLTA